MVAGLMVAHVWIRFELFLEHEIMDSIQYVWLVVL